MQVEKSWFYSNWNKWIFENSHLHIGIADNSPYYRRSLNHLSSLRRNKLLTNSSSKFWDSWWPSFRISSFFRYHVPKINWYPYTVHVSANYWAYNFPNRWIDNVEGIFAFSTFSILAKIPPLYHRIRSNYECPFLMGCGASKA